MLPSEYPELVHYPNLRRLMAEHVDMQIQDIRAMFRLPLPEVGIATGMNFTTGRSIFDLISGASVVFYDASIEVFRVRGDRRARFFGLMRGYFPDLPAHLENLPPETTEMETEQIAQVLWRDGRNPLTHALGLAHPEGATILNLGKAPMGMTAAEILELESDWGLVHTYPFTVTASGDGSRYHIDLQTLYWGSHQMLRKLFADREQADAAEIVAEFFFREPGDAIPTTTGSEEE